MTQHVDWIKAVLMHSSLELTSPSLPGALSPVIRALRVRREVRGWAASEKPKAGPMAGSMAQSPKWRATVLFSSAELPLLSFRIAPFLVAGYYWTLELGIRDMH